MGQRNAALRRTAAGVATADAVEPWSERVALAGQELGALRRETLDELAAAFAASAGSLGLEEAEIVYEPSEVTDGDPGSTSRA